MSDHLQAILSLARAGAISRAWEVFVAAGLAEVQKDPKILTLKGRLLKDQARKAHGEAAARLYLQSAKAYADAAALRPDSYPLINAATMSLFAGQPDHMTMLAQRVLTMLDTGTGAGETPYWHEATRAEALLLLGRLAEAKAAFVTAIDAAPYAWEDRAVTLRQFRQVLELTNEPRTWLVDYTPPPSMYFTGMIGIAADDRRAAHAAHQAIEGTRVGFGYGALAAGADILVAEALIECDAELHLILPMPLSAFRRCSVAPFGGAWLARFDNLLDQATSVSVIAVDENLSKAAINLAAQVAKGAAMENARRLEGRAFGIELNDAQSRSFNEGKDLFIPLGRSAHVISSETGNGQTIVTLVCDRCGGDPDKWTPIADGFFMRTARSLPQAHMILHELRNSTAGVRGALSVSAHANGNATSGETVASVLRMARCAVAGTIVSDAPTARAILSIFPEMWIEPLGELPDARGSIEIYAMAP